MTTRPNAWRNILRRQPSSSRKTSTISYVSLPLEIPLEEETLPYYKPDHYYPVSIGEVYKARYEVAGKLGYGAYSTSWLCRDLQDKHYRALKVSTSLPKFPTATDREVKIYEHLAKINSPHPGQALIRELHDSFDLQGPMGRHRCIVLQPMHMTLFEMKELNTRPFDLPLLKMTIQRLLLALDFLHAEAGVIHAGTCLAFTSYKGFNRQCMLEDFARAESENPSPRKQVNQSHITYKSRKFRRPAKAKGYGLPTLCDFGESRIGATQGSNPFVQPHVYRAPEVMFDMPWGSGADIWNLAGIVWDLFEGMHLFGDVFDARGHHDPFKHFALMVALIGPPPSEFVGRSETTGQCFDPDGTWIASEEAVVPLLSLNSLEKRLPGEEKRFFIQFMKSMLKWLPEERATAKQLLEDPWLR